MRLTRGARCDRVTKLVTSRNETKHSMRKQIPAERKKDVEALLCRTLNVLGALALKSKTKVFPYQVAQWEQELAYCLEELNDMQVSSSVPEPPREAG